MVRPITKTDVDILTNSKSIDALIATVSHVTNIVAQVADRPQVVIPPMPAPNPPPKQLELIVAEIVRGLDGKMTRVIIKPQYID